jgi:hypothetical protein
MSDGKDCTCMAYSSSECACDADWTPSEVISLRAELQSARLIAEKLVGLLFESRDDVNEALNLLLPNAGYPPDDRRINDKHDLLKKIDAALAEYNASIGKDKN